jgi:hypothetical protein
MIDSSVFTFQQILIQHGFLAETATREQAWSVWQKLCNDAQIKQAVAALPVPPPFNITANARYYEKIIASLGAGALAALKLRVGAR